MAERLGSAAGGILGLLELVTEHREAVEFELLTAGFGIADIGTMNLSWVEFRTLARRWQARPHNAVAEAIAGHTLWTVGEQLLAMVLDAVNLQSYVIQRVNGNRSARRPKPLPRPWDEKPVSYDKGALPLDQIDGWIQSTYHADVDQIDEWIDSLEDGE